MLPERLGRQQLFFWSSCRLVLKSYDGTQRKQCCSSVTARNLAVQITGQPSANSAVANGVIDTNYVISTKFFERRIDVFWNRNKIRLRDTVAEIKSVTERMEDAGQKLRRMRERLKLTYRDVGQATQKIAEIHSNYEYSIGLSRSADIENRGIFPSLFRLYSLCAVYKLEFEKVRVVWHRSAGSFNRCFTVPALPNSSFRPEAVRPHCGRYSDLRRQLRLESNVLSDSSFSKMGKIAFGSPQCPRSSSKSLCFHRHRRLVDVPTGTTGFVHRNRYRKTESCSRRIDGRTRSADLLPGEPGRV